MAALGALAENQRRNERVDRGVVTVPATGTATIVLGPTANPSATFVLTNPPGEIGPMRFMTAFQVSLNMGGSGSPTWTPGSLATTAFQVAASINTGGSQTVGSITYPPNTVLTIKTYTTTGTTASTAVGVSFQIWGALNMAGGQF